MLLNICLCVFYKEITRQTSDQISQHKYFIQTDSQKLITLVLVQFIDSDKKFKFKFIDHINVEQWIQEICRYIRVLHAISFARNDFLSSIQGEQTVRTLLKTENILQRLFKSMPTSSSRTFFWIPSSYVHFVTNN